MNKRVMFAVALPVLVLCLLIVRAEVSVNQGESWQLRIAGYDPRDLLRGHYLRFQVDYGIPEGEQRCEDSRTCCICLEDSGARIPATSWQQCTTAKTECDSIIRAEFEHSLNRFYIPEEQASRAEALLLEAQVNENAFLQVSVSESGKPVIKDLMIGDVPLESLLNEGDGK